MENIIISSDYTSLQEYLIATKVDEIEDDEEFCEAEYDEINDYYQKHKFWTDEDMACLFKRGYDPNDFQIE